MGTDDSTPDADLPPADLPPDESQDEDETRRKFREALARKQGRDHLGGTAAPATPHPHAAPAKRGRTFRRKSG